MVDITRLREIAERLKRPKSPECAACPCFRHSAAMIEALLQTEETRYAKLRDVLSDLRQSCQEIHGEAPEQSEPKSEQS